MGVHPGTEANADAVREDANPAAVLKPCPFCGAKPAHDHTRADGVRFSCLQCDEAAFEDFDQAREFWNRRARAPAE